MKISARWPIALALGAALLIAAPLVYAGSDGQGGGKDRGNGGKSDRSGKWGVAISTSSG